MKVFGIRLFENRRQQETDEAQMAVLRGLLEAQREEVSPQERLAALMQLGDQELGRKSPSPAAVTTPAVAAPAAEPNEEEAGEEAVRALLAEDEPAPEAPAPIAELDTARLVELLGSEDDPPARSSA